eukprot:scaffold128265_cov35-Tisochrysis_lutea.AAC.1
MSRINFSLPMVPDQLAPCRKGPSAHTDVRRATASVRSQRLLCSALSRHSSLRSERSRLLAAASSSAAGLCVHLDPTPFPSRLVYLEAPLSPP